MGYGLSHDYHEHTSLGAWRTFFATIAGPGVQWFYWLSLQPLFGGKAITGVRWVGAMAGLLILAMALPAALFCREPSEPQHQPKVRLRHALAFAWQNVPFRIILATSILVIVGFGCVGPFALYILVYRVSHGVQAAGAMWAAMFGSAYSVATFPILPVIARCSKRFGKKYMLIAGVLVSAGASLASLILFSPQHPWLVVVSGILIAPAGTCIWILLWSMIADCCDSGDSSDQRGNARCLFTANRGPPGGNSCGTGRAPEASPRYGIEWQSLMN